MTVPKREEQLSEASGQKCPECHMSEKSIEASRARYEHFLSLGRSRGERRLMEHMIEQFGEKEFKMRYAGDFAAVKTKLMIESWREG